MLKRILIFLLCFLAVFAIISCKEEPEPEANPSPSSGSMYYHLAATAEAKRFALQYDDLSPTVGDVLTFKYRTNHEVTDLFLRNAAGVGSIKQVDIEPYIIEGEDGWISFKFTFDETLDGIRLELANYSSGKFQPNDYLDIMDLSFNGEKLTIDEANEANNFQSDHGIWNNDDYPDHTFPTLEVKYL